MRKYNCEPDLAEMLSDPIVLALMRADRCDLRSLVESLEAVCAEDRSGSNDDAA
jgi:hypothetical protein